MYCLLPTLCLLLQTPTPQVVGEMKDLVSRYDAAVVEEQALAPEARIVANVGKMDAKKHLAGHVTQLMAANINQAMGTMLDTVVF